MTYFLLEEQKQVVGKKLMDEARRNGYNNQNDDDTNDGILWEDVLCASFNDIRKCLDNRGEQFKMAFRIMVCFYKKLAYAPFPSICILFILLNTK